MNILVLDKAIQQVHSIDYVTVVSTKARAKRCRQNGQLFNERSLSLVPTQKENEPSILSFFLRSFWLSTKGVGVEFRKNPSEAKNGLNI